MSTLDQFLLVMLFGSIATMPALWFYRGWKLRKEREDLDAQLKDIKAQRSMVEGIRLRVTPTLEQETKAGTIASRLQTAIAAISEASTLISELSMIGENGVKLPDLIASTAKATDKLQSQFAAKLSELGLLAAQATSTETPKKDGGGKPKPEVSNGGNNSNPIAKQVAEAHTRAGVGWSEFWQEMQEVAPELKDKKFGAFGQLDTTRREAIIAAAETRILAAKETNGATTK